MEPQFFYSPAWSCVCKYFYFLSSLLQYGNFVNKFSLFKRKSYKIRIKYLLLSKLDFVLNFNFESNKQLQFHKTKLRKIQVLSVLEQNDYKGEKNIDWPF